MSSAGDVDRETALAGSPDGDKADLRLWLRLLSCVNLIETDVRQRLRQRFGTTLPRFDLLAQLERVPAGLTLGEISRRMMVTNGNITAVAASLEAEGLVSRQAHASDRRAQVLRLTPAGRRVFARLSVEHERWIAALFGRVASEDRVMLYRLLGGVKSSVRSALAEGEDA